MFRLLPREEKFFDLFEQQGANIVAAARALESLTLDYPNAKTHAQEIENLEHDGDALTHELVRRLNTTFITPINREDIYAMSSRLDDGLDLTSTRWRTGSCFTRSSRPPTGAWRWPRSS